MNDNRDYIKILHNGEQAAFVYLDKHVEHTTVKTGSFNELYKLEGRAYTIDSVYDKEHIKVEYTYLNSTEDFPVTKIIINGECFMYLMCENVVLNVCFRKGELEALGQKFISGYDAEIHIHGEVVTLNEMLNLANMLGAYTKEGDSYVIKSRAEEENNIVITFNKNLQEENANRLKEFNKNEKQRKEKGVHELNLGEGFGAVVKAW